MVAIKKTLSILTISLALFSCGASINNLSSGNFSKKASYKIYSYASSCCGCNAEYFNIYNNGEVNEQVIYKYNCYNPGMPTKFIFNYNEYGILIYCNKLVATTEDDFEEALNDNERALFTEINKSKVLTIGEKIIRYSAIKGFRKAKEQETTHQFPLSKKAYRVPVR